MKTLYISFTILHGVEVPDEFTDAEAAEMAEEYAGECGFLTLCNDIELEMLPNEP